MSRKPERAPGAQIPPSQITPTIKAFAGPSPIVWARYNPSGALGRIDVTKLEKAPNGMINIIIRRWGPELGEKWTDPFYPHAYYGGVSPFKPFDQGDGNWHNTSQQAFLSAVGHAMRNQRSSLSYIAIPELRQETRTEESGGVFKKKVKTIVDWYAKPRWIVGGPIERGGAAAFTTAFRVAGCDPAKSPKTGCIARAGVSFITFDGGNMPATEYKAASFEQEQSGFTFITMILATVVLAWATAGAALWAMGPAGAPAAIGAEAIAGISGGVYGVASGGGNLTSAQTQWLGEVGNGQLQANPSGGWADPTQAVNGSWVQPDMAGTQGGLNQHWQKYQPRASEYSETNGVLMLREGTPVQSGIMDGINSAPQQ